MAFDILFAYGLANELNDKFAFSKVDKVNQPTKENLILSLRCKGENVKLLISTNASCARISQTNALYENPASPPMFTMLLRKHLQGAIISKIDTLGFDRIICIHFQGYDELGYNQEKILICELMGKYSNIIFTDDKYKILGVNRPIDITENRVRQVLSGMIYSKPPVQEKILPWDVNEEVFNNKYLEFTNNSETIDNDTISNFILKTYAGISPCISREIVHRCNISADNLRFVSKLYNSYKEVIDSILNGNIEPTIIYDESNKPIEFSYIDLKQYDNMKKKKMDDLSSLLETYYSEKERQLLLKNRIGNLEVIVKNAIKKALKKINSLNDELSECKDAEKYKRYGELITASLYMLKNKAEFCEVVDYYEQEPKLVKIPLDEKLTPSQNASKYFKKYTKLKSQKENANIQIEKTSNELTYLYSVLDSLEKCTCNDDAVQIREELNNMGYIRDNSKTKDKKKTKMNFIVLKTSSGKTVRVGKNNTQNDYLTLKFANKEDIWFHVKNAPGSHCVLENDGDEILDMDIIECAQIAAYYSSMKLSDNVPIDYTKIRYVKKVPNSNPGFVTFTNNKTVFVEPKNISIE